MTGASRPGPGFRSLVPLAAASVPGQAGAKAARLSEAARAGAPVLPGWVVPCAAGRPALAAAAAAVRAGAPAAARRAALSCPLGPALRAELQAAVELLGGRVIVRSSSPLEGDPLWSGAFSSIAEVGPADVAAAVRSCWAAAFAADPLARLGASGLAPEALRLALLIQPELRPDAGGTARVAAGADGGWEVTLEWVAGHPGALLAGWADGASARLHVPAAVAALAAAPGGWLASAALLEHVPEPEPVPEPVPGPALRPVARGAGGPGPRAALAAREARLAAWLAARIRLLLGDDVTEWAVRGGEAFLLQSAASRGSALSALPGPAAAVPGAGPGAGAAETGAAETDVAGTDIADTGRLAGREWMPLLGAAVRARGQRLSGRPAAAGTAAGRLVPCRPHERPGAAGLDAILLVDRPVPAFAPLLFGARGLIARTGAPGSHLAEVARSLAVPMVTGCPVPAVAGDGPRAGWLAAVDGTTGEVALLAG